MKNAFGEVKRGPSKVEEMISKFEDMLIGTLKTKIQREENEKKPRTYKNYQVILKNEMCTKL